jgi:hypothetical protein
MLMNWVKKQVFGRKPGAVITYKPEDFPSPREKMRMAFFSPAKRASASVYVPFQLNLPELFFEFGYLSLCRRMFRFPMTRKTTGSLI